MLRSQGPAACWPSKRRSARLPLAVASKIAISAAIYRGAKCQKQPENCRKGCRVGHNKTAETQPEEQPKHPKKQSKQLFFGYFGCFAGCFSAVLPRPHRHPFRLFSVSGIWHLCRWPQRLQIQKYFAIWASKFRPDSSTQ